MKNGAPMIVCRVYIYV